MKPKFHEAGVYLVRNLRTGSAYVGASCNLTSRINQHRSSIASDTWCVGGEWRHKLGPVTDWEFRILEFVQVPASECKRQKVKRPPPGVAKLLQREQYWIARLSPDLNAPTIISKALVNPEHDEGRKINDHFSSRYARKLVADDPSFKDFFERRALRSEAAA